MILTDAVEIWARIHGKKVDDFFADFILDNRLDRDTLVGHIFMEFGDLDTCDSNVNMFKKRVEYFFRIHEFNIRKLVDTMHWEYKPLTNVDLKDDRTAHYDQLDDEDTTNDRNLTTDVTENFAETETEGRDEKTDNDRVLDSTDDKTGHESTTEHETEKTVGHAHTEDTKATDYGEDSTEDITKGSTVEQSKDTSDVGKKTSREDVSEDTTSNRNETNIHFVSAFNQIPGSIDPDDVVNGGDVERNRDVNRASETGHKDTNSTGSEDTTNTGTEHVKGTTDESEGHKGHKESGETVDGESTTDDTKDVTRDLKKDTDETEKVVGKEHEVEGEVVREDIDRKRDYDKTNKLVDKEGKVGTRVNDMDRDEEEHSHKFGNDGRYKYQELIEDERRLAEFNIYKWIIRHMAKELFVGVY